MPDANPTTIALGLRAHGYTEEEATALVSKHEKIVASAIGLGSMAYYAVDEILVAEDHECSATCTEDEEEPS